MSYYVYLIKSIKSKHIKSYVGYTNNITKRLEKHNTGKGAKSTRTGTFIEKGTETKI